MSHIESLIDMAQADALRSVSKWNWVGLGAMLSILPVINIVLLVLSAVVVSFLSPKIDLSPPQRLQLYFQNPARYTSAYRRAAKKLRYMRMLYGWLAGVMISNFFFY